VTTLSEGITELVKNANVRNANAVMETCQRLLPQLDDLYRAAMTYGDASLRSEAQRWYTKTRQILLDNLVIAQSFENNPIGRPAPDLCGSEDGLFQGLAGGSARIVEDSDGPGGAAPELYIFAEAFAVAGDDEEKAVFILSR
jgi:hypothetical protein